MSESISLLGSDFKDNTGDQSSRELINVFLEPAENVENAQYIGIKTPGYSLYKDFSGASVRGMIDHNDSGFVVVDDGLYEITNFDAGTAVLRGTLNSSSGRVSIAANTDEIGIADGTDFYSYKLSTTTFTDVTDVDLPSNPSIVIAMQDYFIVWDPTTNQYYHSDISDGTSWSALSTASAETHFDYLVSGVALNTRLWLMCSYTSEIWYNAGNASGSTFSRMSGGAIPFGCAAKHSVATLGNEVIWLAQNSQGLVGVMSASEGSQQILSTPAMLQDMRNYYAIDDAFAWTYQQEGHSFYIITFPSKTASSLGITWMFDVSMGIWSKLESEDTNATVKPLYHRHTANCHMYLNGSHLIGDYRSGKVYKLSPNSYDENGNEIRRVIRSRHITKNKELFSLTNVELDVNSGLGLSGSVQGSDPQVMLRVSKDYGHTYGLEISTSAGKIGEYDKRVRYPSLGTSRVFTLEFSVTDPVDWKFLRLTADVR